METKPDKDMTVKTAVALIVKDISYIKNNIKEVKDSVKEIEDCLNEKYVTKVEFSPVKFITFGFVGIIITAVLGSLIALVVQ